MFPKLVFNCIWLISCTARGRLPLDDSRSCKMFGGLFPFAETVPLSVLFRLVLITFPSRHIEWLSELPCPMASFGIFFFHVAFSVFSPYLVSKTRFFCFMALSIIFLICYFTHTSFCSLFMIPARILYFPGFSQSRFRFMAQHVSGAHDQRNPICHDATLPGPGSRR